MKVTDLQKFKQSPAAGAHLRKFATAGAAVKVEARQATFCISDATVDRAGDSIDPAGWDFASYKRNPVVLFAHNSYGKPVGKCVAGPYVDGGRVMATVEFEKHQDAEDIWQMVQSGTLSATSVGFKPKKWQMNEDRKGEWGMPGVDFLECELLEFSIVPIPCNPNALLDGKGLGDLVRIAKAAGFKADAPESQDAPDQPGQDDGSGDNAEEQHAKMKEYLAAAASHCDALAGRVKDLDEHKAKASAHADQLALHAAESAKSLAKIQAHEKAMGEALKELRSALKDAGDEQPNPEQDKPVDQGGDDGKGTAPTRVKSGRVLSDANYKRIKAAADHCQKVLDEHHAAHGEPDADDEPEDGGGKSADPLAAWLDDAGLTPDAIGEAMKAEQLRRAGKLP